MSVKNSNDTIGNRTRDLPGFSAVPQPTASSRAVMIGVRTNWRLSGSLFLDFWHKVDEVNSYRIVRVCPYICLRSSDGL